MTAKKKTTKREDDEVIEGFDYVFEDAVTHADTAKSGRRSVRCVPVEMGGKQGLAFYSLSRGALEDVVALMSKGAPLAARPLRRPTKAELRDLLDSSPALRALLPGPEQD